MAPPNDRLRRKAAWIVAATGVAQLAVAGYFGLRAFDLESQNMNIDGAAGRAADISTVLSISGFVTTAVAGYLFIISRRPVD